METPRWWLYCKTATVIATAHKQQQVQSNLGKGGIAHRFHSPDGSITLQLHVLGG